jgi:hypothetical protein
MGLGHFVVPLLQFPNLSIRSRGFEVDGVQYLVPFADMLNHQNYAKTRFNRNDDHDTFEMRVDNYYAQGSEVYNNYFPRSNCDLLRLYGFILDTNEVPMKVPIDIALDENDPNIDIKRTFMEKFGLARYLAINCYSNNW